MILRAGYFALALNLQESADMANSDVRSALSDAVRDLHQNSGYGYYLDHFGDDESGDVVYGSNGETMRAPYSITSVNGSAPKAAIDGGAASKVRARTVYEPDCDEADHMAAMAESLVNAEKIYTEIPLYERFISKSEREKADAEDFAGKGKSFPILKPEDVQAAVHAMGRAGSGNLGPSGIKARIIAIAKRKGWEKYLPKAWQAQKASEADPDAHAGALKLSESCAFAVDIPLREAFTASHKIKIIAPGKGSSAFYPTEVLKRDGPKVFRAGTPMRIDHPTRAEESARPEGSVKDWGAVLSTDAVWLEDHRQGPGLYAEVKPFSDHANLIKEKGPYAGVSIRASGNPLVENGRTVYREGVPVLAELTGAEGVDMVTRAGAGGMFLSESQRDSNPANEGDMDEQTVKRLIEAAVNPYRERALKGDAIQVGARVLDGVSLTPKQKTFVIEESLRHQLPLEGDSLDEKKFGEIVMNEAKRLVALLPNGAQVRGLGMPVTEAGKNCPGCDGDGKDEDGEKCADCGGTGKMKAKKTKESREQSDDEFATMLRECTTLGLSEAGAKRAAKGRI